MRKVSGIACSVLALGCAAFFVMAVSDLVTGGSPETGVGVLGGLAVFFGGLTVVSGFGARRLLASDGARARLSLQAAAHDTNVDLEARLLALAAKCAGRVTVTEVAIGCAVSLADAEKALDGLAQCGHAHIDVTTAGDTVYVVRGFLSETEKRAAVDIVEHVRA